MASIRDYLFDTDFLEQSLTYLTDTLKLAVSVIDSQGQTVLNHPAPAGELPARREFSFQFTLPIGGLRCAAPDETALDQAEPHIRYCLAALHNQLQREAELRETTDEMLRLSSQLNFLYQVARKIVGIDDMRKCYQIILAEIAGAIKADQGFIHTRGRWEEEIRVTHRMSDQEVDTVRYNLCLRHANADHTIICASETGASLLFSPIKEKEGSSGQAVFIREPGQRPFSAYEKQFVGIIENIISPTFETLRLYDSLQDLYLNTVKALAAAIDAKDEYTHGHSFRVAKYAIAIGSQLELDNLHLNDLEISGYMHDLGKIGVSEMILGKPGKLTHDEFRLIQKHPVFTDKILQPIKLPDRILEGAIQHHERMDGTGYPYGLKGTEISLFGRIIAVADVFDALTSKRPYRDALPVEEALKTMCDGIDCQYDREVLLAFIAALRTNRLEEMLGEINLGLRYEAVQNFNQFLVELTEFTMSPARQETTITKGTTEP